MSFLLDTILFVFALVALGYLCALSGYLSPAAGDGIAEFAVAVAMPMLLFRTMSEADFHGAAPWALWTTYFGAVAVAWTAGHLAVTRFFGRDSQTGVIAGVSTAFSNTVLLGGSMVLGIYGQDGFDILALIIAVHLPALLMVSMILFQLFATDGKPLGLGPLMKDFALKMATNPLIVGIAAGFAWRQTGLSLPVLADRIVDTIADLGGPLALFAIGAGLRKFGISGNIRPALALAALKLMLMPAAALALALLFELPPLAAKVAVLAAALPAGVNPYLIAVKFGKGEALASNQVSLSVAGGIVTTTFWLAVATHVFG